MAVDFVQLGKRIAKIRDRKDMSQSDFSSKLSVSRKHISLIETGNQAPSIDLLVEIANVLEVSVDDLLVDSLQHSASTANSQIHQLLLDCNKKEEEILTQTVKELKAILYGLGI